MARTLIGRLILQMQAQGLGEARRVTSAMGDIERAARAASSAPMFNWGANFQRNLDRLNLMPNDLRAVRQSWVNLHDSMRSRNIAGTLRSAEISTWRNQTLQHFGAVKTGYSQQLAAMESRSRIFRDRMNNIMKPALVMLGGYTGFYMAGTLGREGITAGAERRREQFRQDMAGISEEDQEKLFAHSQSLGYQFPSVPITDVMELSRSAYATMGDADRANAVLDGMVRGLVTMQSASGPEAAVALLRKFMRAMDNLGVNEVGELGVGQINELIDASVRWSQIDPDFDIGDFWGFARRAKVFGPAASMGFLGRAPAFMQDQGAETTGNALAMLFKGFVLEAVGTAGGKRYIEERDRMGLRANGELIDRNLFGSDPDLWVLEHLIPALERDGVDLDNNTEVAASIGKLTGNTVASGLMTKMVTQREQVARLHANQQRTMGLEAADLARHEDPFVAWAAFKKSLENLSAALLPMEQISAGLNSLADGINKVSSAAEDNPGLTALTLGAAGYGAWQGGKAVWNRFDPFGLRVSATALDGSAAALTRAAVALGGQGVAGTGGVDTTGRRSPGQPRARGIGIGAMLGVGFGLEAKSAFEERVKAWLGTDEFFLPTPSDALRAAVEQIAKHVPTAPPASIDQMRAEREAWLAREAADKAAHDDWNAPVLERIMPPASVRPGPEHAVPTMDDAPLLNEAHSTAADLEASLSVTATPKVDTSAIDTAIAKARQLLNLLRQVGDASEAARSNVGAEMRRGLSDAMP